MNLDYIGRLWGEADRFRPYLTGWLPSTKAGRGFGLRLRFLGEGGDAAPTLG